MEEKNLVDRQVLISMERKKKTPSPCSDAKNEVGLSLRQKGKKTTTTTFSLKGRRESEGERT